MAKQRVPQDVKDGVKSVVASMTPEEQQEVLATLTAGAAKVPPKQKRFQLVSLDRPRRVVVGPDEATPKVAVDKKTGYLVYDGTARADGVVEHTDGTACYVDEL